MQATLRKTAPRIPNTVVVWTMAMKSKVWIERAGRGATTLSTIF